MRMMRFLTLGAILVVVSGCSSIVGTWNAAGSDNPIANASFCCDGTFTANAVYGDNKSHASSGLWKHAGGKLKLDVDGKTREYEIDVSRNEMSIKHEGKTSKMTRVKGCW